MKVYICHASSFDYRKELYEPIWSSHLNKIHTFILPHEKKDVVTDSENIIKQCDLIVAEVSYPSTGMGIELGWAYKEGKKIVCIYRKGAKNSSSLKFITNEFKEYNNTNSLLEVLSNILN